MFASYTPFSNSARRSTALGIVTYLESAAFLVAAEFHSGVALLIGHQILEWTHVPAAALLEFLCAIPLLIAGYGLVSHRVWGRRVAAGAHAGALAASFAILAPLGASSGPRPLSDAVSHLLMIPVLTAMLAICWARRSRYSWRRFQRMAAA